MIDGMLNEINECTCYFSFQLFHVLIRSKTNVSSQFSTMSIAHGQISQIIVKWTNRAQGIFPLPSFCPTCYGLSNVMRRKGTRHAFIECRQRENVMEESTEKRMLLSN